MAAGAAIVALYSHRYRYSISHAYTQTPGKPANPAFAADFQLKTVARCCVDIAQQMISFHKIFSRHLHTHTHKGARVDRIRRQRDRSEKKTTNEKMSDLLMVELLMAGVGVSPPFIKLGSEKRHFAQQTQFSVPIHCVHYSVRRRTFSHTHFTCIHFV